MGNFFSFLALVFAVGCGASRQQVDSASRAEQAVDLETSLQNENYSDPALLPATGRAIYAGFGTLNLPIGGTIRSYVRDLDLEVAFGSSDDQLSGTLQRFDGLTGALDIANGTLDRTADTDEDFTIGAAVTGTLGTPDGDYSIDASLVGDIRGRNQDGITGVVFGDIRGPDGIDIFDSTIAAERAD